MPLSAAGTLRSRLPPVALHRPVAIDEACTLLDGLGAGVAPLGGGTELVPRIKQGHDVGALVDLKRIPELQDLVLEAGELVIGAAVTHARLARAEVVRDTVPSLARVARAIGNPRVRAAGTIGGSLASGDPQADLVPLLLAHDARVTCAHRTGARVLPVADLVGEPFRVALKPGEIITAIRLALPPPCAVLRHGKVVFHARAAAVATCRLEVEGSRVGDARVTLGAAGVAPMRARAAEGLLVGQPVSANPAIVERVADAAAAGCAARDDRDGSREYRLHVLRTIVGRTVTATLEAAGTPTSA